MYLLNYRVVSYASFDAILELQLAIRYLRHTGEELGICAPDKIGTIRFSEGAMHCYGQTIAFRGNITPDTVYQEYVCDDVDGESADTTVAFMKWR